MQCELHEDFEMVIVCLNSQCEKTLGCAKCIQDFHFKHPEDCHFIEDIINKNNIIDKSNSELKKKKDMYEKFLQKKQNLEDEKFLNIMDQFTYNLLKTVQLERGQLQQQMETKSSNFKPSVDSLKKQFNARFDLKKIEDIYNEFSEGKLNEDQVKEQVELFLKDEHRVAQKNQMMITYQEVLLFQQFEQCQRRFPRFLEKEFDQIKETLLSQLENISGVLSISGEMEFFIPKIVGTNLKMKLSADNRKANFNSADQSQMVLTSLQMTYPQKYKWSLKFENYQAAQNLNLIIGIIQEDSKDQLNQVYKNGVSIYINLTNNAKSSHMFQQVQGKFVTQIIKTQNAEQKPVIMNILFDLKKSIFTCEVKDEGLFYEYSLKKAISQYGSQNIPHIYQFFDKRTSFRGFILNHGAILDVTLQ